MRGGVRLPALVVVVGLLVVGVWLPVTLQPKELVTVQLMVKELPEDGAVYVIVGVPWPAVMLPALRLQV